MDFKEKDMYSYNTQDLFIGLKDTQEIPQSLNTQHINITSSPRIHVKRWAWQHGPLISAYGSREGRIPEAYSQQVWLIW